MSVGKSSALVPAISGAPAGHNCSVESPRPGSSGGSFWADPKVAVNRKSAGKNWYLFIPASSPLHFQYKWMTLHAAAVVPQTVENTPGFRAFVSTGPPTQNSSANFSSSWEGPAVCFPIARRGTAPLERIVPASSLTVVLADYGYVGPKNPAFGVNLIHSIWLLQFGPIEGFATDARTATFNSKGGSPHAER